MSRAISVLSGGLDSTVALAIALRENEEVFALHLNYKHRTEKRELKAFYDIVNYYGIKNVLVVDVNYLSQIGGSALTDKNIKVPEFDPDRKGIPATYVPFRNAHLLSIAVSWAEVIDADYIYIGAVEEDSSGYPDCRKVFYEAFQKAIFEGTKKKNIFLKTPLIDKRKSEIVKIGVKLEVPFHLTWSCYVREDVACGRCDSCGLRLRGFKEAGFEDPLPYLEKNI